MYNNTFFELSLGNFKRFFPDIYSIPPVRSLVDGLMSDSDADKYRVRFQDDKLEIGFADDDWNIK